MTSITPPHLIRHFGRPVAGIAVLGFLTGASTVFGADPVSVPTLRPSRGDITRFIALPGTLRPNQQVTVQARVAGFVTAIPVDRGDRVDAGQTLAEIEVPELIAERTKQLAVVKVAESETRRLEAGRQKSPDLITPQSLEAAIGRLEVARAELERTETLLRYARLVAPFAGVLSTGAAGAVASTVKVLMLEFGAVPPALSAVARMVCAPSARATEGVKVQLPEPSAVVVPIVVPSTITLTVRPAPAVPV